MSKTKRPRTTRTAERSRQPANEPRNIEHGRAWYYVNRSSVDLVTREPDVATITTRLTRRMLAKMLAELKPLNASQQEQD